MKQIKKKLAILEQVGIITPEMEMMAVILMEKIRAILEINLVAQATQE